MPMDFCGDSSYRNIEKQIESGSLVVDNLRITPKPDVFIAGKARIVQTPQWFLRTETLFKNRLAPIVKQSNPKKLKALEDLGRKDIRVSMLNPEREGIGKRIEEPYVKQEGKT